jgi:hypothetical protein
MPALDFDEMANRIIRVEGLAFARASLDCVGSTEASDFGLACDALKKAIVDALEKVAKSETTTTTESNDAETEC